MNSKNLTRKYCGPKLVNAVKKLTTSCYFQAVETALSSLNLNPKTPITEIDYALRVYRTLGELDDWWLQRTGLIQEEFLELRTKTDDIYIEKLISLSTKQIEDILWVHEKRRIVRAPRTVEALLAELARRFLLQDNSCL